MLQMANIKATSSLIIRIILLAFVHTNNAYSLKSCKFDSIYQLGDSFSDTGNSVQEDPKSVCGRPPYGENFWNHESTGRCSNGLLMIDYFALSSGIPLLDAYLNPSGTFTHGHGVNFAVAGSTALPVYVLASKGIYAPVTNTSLSTQLDWMLTHFNSICYDKKDCEEKLKNALFMIGEIGGNDYNYALFQGKSIEEVTSMVPYVVQAITDAIDKAIDFGARRVVVPGNFPIGCFPAYLTRFRSNDVNAYDELHCLKGLNNLISYHNRLLNKAIRKHKTRHPQVIILYADYYNSFLWILRRAKFLGFDTQLTQKSCCGIGGDYDVSLTKTCGARGVPVCGDPNQRISWDGINLTQKAYQYMSAWLIHNIFPKLRCNLA